ncbi:NAD(P)/FAD-dependent oxidoreductase [Parafrankia sp. EUN1f]|uniref:NAD(P)/FAD-dependent oxidoreductase n=1 Tax=Parafrankia sp. EUN1f TaxID=102897 RepID=UPI0001C4636E|nr:FAD/NAD(P)-binding oxidoreductase [Parafrankia sp. EUN1f]EFC81446.1 FAD-dependent pyridine nucleotide-disulphide oxidoreductase [Parafrankia sp. EUN1f]
MLTDIVVVGSSVAGVRAVETLRERGYDGRVTLVGADAELPYDRPPLSKELLTGELTEHDVRLVTADRLTDLRVEPLLGHPAVGLDLAAQVVHTTTGDVRYDGLIIATGSTPVRPRGWPSLDGVHTLRDLGDARAIAAALRRGSPRVVVIGAGFVGCEIAAAARLLGLDTTVVESQPWPLRRALRPDLVAPIVRLHRDHGVRLRCGTEVRALLGTTRVEQVELADGTLLDADLVVIGIGAVPVTDWLAGSGLAVGDGVLTDRTLRASAPNVYAAGDVARWPSDRSAGSHRVEHWTNARKQGARAAANLLDPAAARPFTDVPYVWSDQHGRRLQLAGATRSGEMRFLLGGPDEASYLAVFVEHGVVVGAVGFDRPRDFQRVRRVVGTDIAWSELAEQHSSVG